MSSRIRPAVASFTVIAILGALALVSVVQPAAAAVTATMQGNTLKITGSNGPDNAIVDCVAGQLEIGGSPPASGAFACANLESIEATLGGGNDLFQASGLSNGNVPSLSHVVVEGQGGNDNLFGTQKSGDELIGGDGGDFLGGGPGSDVHKGGAGTDSVVHNGVNLTLTDTLLEEGIYDDMLSSIEVARFSGTSGIDTWDASAFTGDLVANPEDGADSVTGGSGDDYLDTGDGADTLNGGAGDDDLVPGGGNFNDVVNGGPGFDRFIQNFGTVVAATNTQISGANGPFPIGTDPHTGIEKVWVSVCCGSSANTSAFNGPAIITGDGGAETLTGGPMNDLIDPVSGDDMIFGGGGTDRVVIEADDLEVTTTGASEDLWTATFDSIERFTGIASASPSNLDASGFNGKVKLIGNTGVDALRGGPMADRLKGGEGKDGLAGEGGNDRLDGGPGKDVCKGGPGNNKLKNCP